MAKNKVGIGSVLLFILKLVVKLFIAFWTIPVILLVALFWFFSFLIDAFAGMRDADFLSDEEAQKRKIDRTNKRQHNVLEKIFDIFKAMFCW